MIIFLYGKDTFRSRRQLKKIIEKFKEDRDPQGYNVHVCHAHTTPSADVWEQLFASPFLSEKRLVILEGFLAKGDVDMLERLSVYIEKKELPPSTIVVFWEDGSVYKKKVVKALYVRLQQEPYAQEFALMGPVEVEGWLAAEITSGGAHIDRDALHFLSKNAGDDLWYLQGVIEQCIAHACDRVGERRPISLADVRLFVDQRIDDNIFNLVDAIVAQNVKHAFFMIEEQYRIGKDSLYIFAMLLRQFRILLQMRDLYEREDVSSSKEMAGLLGIHPFVAKKSLSAMRGYTMKRLQEVYTALLQLDIAIKRGGGKPKALLDVFVSQISV
ncbi:DNA polymerase III subunit delta [Patescibacteria group bacterium]|nr:DNA polymerase III subunit delta [Patescibacteria group bacterium]MBU1721306.1 DNA polymerase III subunit delta [Patescibacteria group bacterium]MBU1900818.1 DNA polymerase III subunit delta [Patescibacteria group bacterium]